MKNDQISEKLKETLKQCPQCSSEIEWVNPTDFYCSTCGLKIYIETQKTRLIVWSFIATLSAFMIGWLIALMSR